MELIPTHKLVCFAILILAGVTALHSYDVPRAATTGDAAQALRYVISETPDDGGEKTARRPNVLIIGASSFNSPPFPVGHLLEAMLKVKGIQMDFQSKWLGRDAVKEALSSKPAWDYVIMDAWHFGQGNTDPPNFPRAVAEFAKQVRAHSPTCKIILLAWWLPGEPKAANKRVIEAFHRCVEEAKVNKLWVATIGPAFMEARLARPDLHVTISKTDAHPGIHGVYLNSCSLFSLITGRTPVGLPATLKIPGAKKDFAIAADDAKYLQELAWKVYLREIKNTKPANEG
jgi:hypothetical protein